MLKLKRRQGQSSPVTTIRAVLRKETRQEPRHFETGVEKNLQSKPGPRVGSGGAAGVAARGRGPQNKSEDRGSAREGAAQAGPLRRGARSRAPPSLAPRCGVLRQGGGCAGAPALRT